MHIKNVKGKSSGPVEGNQGTWTGKVPGDKTIKGNTSKDPTKMIQGQKTLPCCRCYQLCARQDNAKCLDKPQTNIGMKTLGN